MQARCKTNIPKQDARKQQTAPRDGIIGQKRHRNDRCARKMTAGEGFVVHLFFVDKRGDSRARFRVGARAVDGKPQYTNDEQGQ